jgi:hypothetical protein
MDCPEAVNTFERDQKAATTDQTTGHDQLSAHLWYEIYLPQARPRNKADIACKHSSQTVYVHEESDKRLLKTF